MPEAASQSLWPGPTIPRTDLLPQTKGNLHLQAMGEFFHQLFQEQDVLALYKGTEANSRLCKIKHHSSELEFWGDLSARDSFWKLSGELTGTSWKCKWCCSLFLDCFFYNRLPTWPEEVCAISNLIIGFTTLLRSTRIIFMHQINQERLPGGRVWKFKVHLGCCDNRKVY